VTNYTKVLVIFGIMLCINAGVFFYAWDQGRKTSETACEASALVSGEVQKIYQRNIQVAYPELYRRDQISIEGLDTLTTNAVSAIIRLKEAERKCETAIH